MKKILSTFIAMSLILGLYAQSPAKFWQDMPVEHMSLPEDAEHAVQLNQLRGLSLNFNGMAAHLQSAPLEGTGGAYLTLDFPMPDGSVEKFGIYRSPIMQPGLAAEYPEIQTYAGHSLNNPDMYLRFVFSPIGGFYGLAISNEATIRISPYIYGQIEYYKSYFEADVIAEPDAPRWECGVHEEHEGHDHLDGGHLPKEKVVQENGGRNPLGLVDRYEYRVAIATTGEFSLAYGNTPTSVLTRVTEVLSDMNTVYERDNAIRLNLVDNSDEVFFFGGATDPYTNGNTDAMIDENPPVLNGTIGSSNFDIGHVFGTNAGGLAQLGSVCSGTNKARGVSCEFGLFSGDGFYLIPCHEVGHQFTATHTFNNCDDFETPSTAYEPGSGSTIMGYSGAAGCSDQYIENMNLPYFHNNSMERIREFSRDQQTGGSCAEVIVIGNNMPEVTIPFGEGLTIPISTPFELTASASDADGDDLTYCWEQYNLGPKSPLGSPIGNAPSFRSYPPTNSPTRVFPRMDRVVNNQNHPHEVLPTYTRDLNFRCTVRDNNEEVGSYGFEEVAFEAIETAGPFLVMNPNASGISWEVGDFVEVTWDVANTTSMPVNCQTVNILLSLDGGFNYPITLLSGTPNDGSAMVTVPNEITDVARVRVEAADNIFFDISNNDFSIVEPLEPGFSFTVSPQQELVCLPQAFEASIETSSLLGFTEEITLSASNLPSGAVANFSANPIAPGDAATVTIDMTDVDVSGNFTITISAAATGVPNADRNIDLNLIDNDFSALQLLTPAGASGTGTLPSFTWTDLPNGLSYNIRIATDIGFTNIIDEDINITSTNYSPAVQLEENTNYYWQISVNNECGTSDWSNTGAFKTVSQSCETFTKSEDLSIPGSLGAMVSSTINVSSVGEISDVNLENITGDYDGFGNLRFTLVSPDESQILIPGGSCFSLLPFDFGIDDEAPSPDIPCPPENGTIIQPANPLSIFDDTEGSGNWTLEVNVVGNQPGGGDFTGWSLELCGAASPSDPYLVTNETLSVPPNESRLVFVDKLEVDDDDDSAQFLTFTVIDDVQHGQLSVDGVDIGVGGNFTMTDVYGSRVVYTNTDGTALTDRFTFTVHDPNGGFFGTPAFNIVIDQNAPPDNTNEILSSDELLVYPNPTSDLLNVEFLTAINGNVGLALFNAQGQLLLTREFDEVASKIQLEVGDLPTGFHLLQVTTENGFYTKKVMVE